MSATNTILQFSEDITNAPPPQPLPKGPYPAEIIGAAIRTSGTSGNQYAAIQFRVNPESYPADYTDGDPDGTVLTFNRLLWEDTPKTRYRWRQFMERVGGPLGRNIDLNVLIGLNATIDVTHQDYEGEQQAQVARILAP